MFRLACSPIIKYFQGMKEPLPKPPPAPQKKINFIEAKLRLKEIK
jgi:hypothetical protein